MVRATTHTIKYSQSALTNQVYSSVLPVNEPILTLFYMLYGNVISLLRIALLLANGKRLGKQRFTMDALETSLPDARSRLAVTAVHT